MAHRLKDTRNWVGQVEAHNMKIVLGHYRTKKAAEKAENDAYARIKRVERQTLDNYKLNYEKIRKNKHWLDHPGSWFKREWMRLKVLWREQ